MVDFDKINWRKIVNRRCSPLIASLMLGMRVPKVFGFDFPASHFKFEQIGAHTDFYQDQAELTQQASIVSAQIEKDPSISKAIVEKMYSYSNFLVRSSELISKFELNKCANDSLKHLFELYCDILEHFSATLWMPFAFEVYLTDKIKDKLKVQFPNAKDSEIDDYFQKITVVSKDSDPYLQQKNSLKLAVLKLIDEDISVDLNSQHTEFAWMGGDISLLTTPWDREFFVNQVEAAEKPLDKYLSLKENRARSIREYKEFINELPNNLINDAELLQEFMYLRAYRIDSFKKSNLMIKTLIMEIAKRNDISSEDITYFTREDVLKLFTDGTVPTDIDKRKEYFKILVDGEKRYYSSNKPEEEEAEKVELLTGKIACGGGVISGPAKIIKSKSDMHKFNNGDILISSMTTPDIAPIMSMASAIVTDEGGILCHAAIVSREYGIPCIIGTKLATKIFKDGDLIRVDAKNGTVGKIEFINSS